jgi:pentatricopeptide repeat protein
MPIYNNLYSNLARQGFAKTFTHGYAQSVVAVTHPSSYPNQHHRTGFGRRPSKLGKLSSYQFQNAFHNSASSSSITLQEGRQEKSVSSDGGLEAYFEAWKKQHAAGAPEKEWTQFQFTKRLEWKPTVPVVESKGKGKADVEQVFAPSRPPLERSYSFSALDDLKKISDEVPEVASVDAANGEPIQEVKDSQEQYSAAADPRVPSPPLAPEQTPALGPAFEHSANVTPPSNTTIDIQSQTYAEHLTKLSAAGRYAEIPAVFEAMLVAGIQPIATAYNALLNAAINLPTERIQVVPKALDVYSDMLKRKVLPNTATYDTLLNLLASRSLEVSSLKKSLEDKRIRFGGMEEPGKFMFASSEMEYAILSEDDRLDLAVKLFDASISVRKDRFYPAETYHNLITACAEASRVPDMVRLYEHMESSKVIPLAATFPPMIQSFTKGGNLVSAVECYNEYKALAMSHDSGKIDMADRHDAAVYAAVVKAYVNSDKLEGAIKFYKKIVDAYGTQSTALRDIVISKGFVQGMIDRGLLAEALGWAEGLEYISKVAAMSKISTLAADRGDRVTAASAFANLSSDDHSIATPAMALLALSVREGDVEAASQHWQILASPDMTVTSAFIEPAAMYAVALIGSGQVAEGLTQSEQMFRRIKASAKETKSILGDEVDEGIEFVSRYMAERGISDPRATEVPPMYQQEPFTPAPYAASIAPPPYEDTYDPYAASTDFKGSALIADELERGNGGRAKGSRLNEALARFRNIRRAGRHPRYITYAKLISAAAREDRMNLVHDILGMAKTDVPLQTPYSVVRYGWVSILDAMVGACLTLGNRTLAAQYHQELLDMGAAPTANTFGLYITTLKESTKTFDEASEAVKIFHRAKTEGVEPSSFLYNALIGKLGKARRIDDCLFYFAEMRSLGIRPTSVTYGTIVNALCRVSDEKFAEELFEEMESMPNYKARPAPYNSLMQFFLTTKRDKSKVLAYYERMKSKGIQPTNHTYKLLIDTHATLEPVNMSAAEAVLDVIRSTGEKPEAVHYASLIHAKGCVLHDLDGARTIFDAVLSDPSIRPQACLYQALFEAMVANHQFSDTETILDDMASRRVEMTPYIANTLIHGWANEKNIEKSKAIFSAVGRDKREPSTYEAMTRAYLAVEDRQSAKSVVQEMLSRGYPSAVSTKIMELVGGGNAGVY